MPDQRIVNLIVQFEEAQQQGGSCTPEELCHDCPELLEPLREALRSLGHLREVMPGPDDTELYSATPPSGPAVPAAGAAPAAGRYRPIHKHAEGGLGEVFEAEDAELKRIVALKRMKEHCRKDPGLRRRFLQEAEVTGRLEHPGVVPVYGLGLDPAGQPCYAMRFIRGQTLHAAIQAFHKADDSERNPGERSLALRELLGQFVAVCKTVAYAHSRGIVHRDLKPNNVMLGKYGEALVVDWGLAKAVGRTEEDRASGEETLTPTSGGDSGTRVGKAMGTPAYMSPEQASGQWDRLGPASDIYSLGATLYALLTGQSPFPEPDVERKLMQVWLGEFTPPGQLKRNCPPALEAICLKAMAKRPEDRYATALALAADLEHWLADEPVSAWPEPWRARAGRWLRRHRGVAAGSAGLAAAALVALVGVVVLVGRHAAELADEKAQTEENYVRAEKNHAEALRQEKTAAEARQRARVAELEKWQTTLANYHARADARLADLRLLGDSGRPGARQEVLDRVAQIAKLRQEAGRDLKQMGGLARLLAPEDEHRWEARADLLRNEAARWLTAIRLEPGTAVALPEGPEAGELPIVAVGDEPRQLAVTYPGSTTVFLLGPEGKVRAKLAVPEDFARAARSVEKIVRRWSLSRTQTTTNRTVKPYRFAFVKADRLEYQVGPDVLSWSLPDGKRQRQQRPHSSPGGPFNRHASNDRYLARVAGDGSAVTLEEHQGKAGPRVVWQTRDKQETGKHERVRGLTFGGNGRALFIQTDLRLSLVDAPSGLAADASLTPQDKETKAAYGVIVPCRAGVGMVERLTVRGLAGPPRLRFWTAALPRARLEALHHDDPARGLDLAADGVLVTGGGDHLVRAWRGERLTWAAGIPYLQATKARRGRDRLPSVGVPPRDLTHSESFQFTTADRSNGWVRRAWAPTELGFDEYPTYSPPLPFPWADFAAGGKHSLVVERRVLLANGQSKLRTEVYSPEDGRLVHTFPEDGKGRLYRSGAGATVSPDHRFALVVAEEKGKEAVLDVWSVEEQRALGRLGRYPLPRLADGQLSREVMPVFTSFVTAGGKDWLLVARPLKTRAAGQLEVWRLPAVERVGAVTIPTTVHYRPLAVPDNAGHALLLGGTVFFPPRFALVLDLETATKVCDLEGYLDPTGGRYGERFNAILAGSRYLLVQRGLYSAEPYSIRSWGLTTGQHRKLGDRPWINGDNRPVLQLSPGADRLLVFGNLHDSGMAHVELWDLAGMKLLRQDTFPTAARPSLGELGDTFFSVRLEDLPEKGKTRTLSYRWADGTELLERAADPWRLVGWNFSPLQNSRWLVWRSRAGLALQGGAGDKRVPLENAGGATVGGVRPAPAGPAVALDGPDGGYWNARTGRQLAHLPDGHHHRGFDPTGRWALTVTDDGELWSWDLQAGKAVYHCRPADSPDAGFDPLETLPKVSPDGKRLVVLSRGALLLWDIEHNRRILTLERPGHMAPVTCVAQHAGAGLVASANEEGVILLWDRATGKQVRSFLDHPAGTAALAFAADGKHLASASREGTVFWRDLKGNKVWARRVTKPGVRITGLAYHATRPAILVCTEAGRLVVLNSATGEPLANREIDPTGLQALAVSPDGTAVALAGKAGKVHLLDAATWQKRRSWDTLAPVQALAFVGGPRLLATGGQAVQLWDTETGRGLCTLETPHGPVRFLALDGKTGELAVADQGQQVVVYHLPDLQRQLGRLGLALPDFPRWPAPAGPTAAAPPGWQDWLGRAEQWLAAGDTGSAAWAASRAIEAAPGEWKPRYVRARVLARFASRTPDRSWWEKALADYGRALALKADDWHIWDDRGDAYFALRQYREAVRDYSRAIALGPKEGTVWHDRGLARYRLHEYDLALADFDKALGLDPGKVDWQVRRCEVLRKKRAFDRARADLDRIIKLDPRWAWPRAVRGAVYRDQGDLHKAAADLDEAVRLDPGSAYAFTQRGELRRQLKQPDRARADLDAAVALSYSTDPVPYAPRGLMALQRNDLARAILDFSDAVRLDPENALAYYLRGQAHRLRKAPAPAVADYNRAIELDPGIVSAWLERGMVYSDRGLYDKAIADFDEAIRRAPRLAAAYNNRGVAYRKKGQRDRALADYDAAVRLGPRLAAAYNNRGWIRAEMRQWDRAAADFAQAVELAPSNAGWRIEQALAFLGGGKTDDYRAACARLAERFAQTKDPGTATRVALVSLLVPRPAAEVRPHLALAERAAASNPDNTLYVMVLGAALYRAGRYEEAVKNLSRSNARHAKGGYFAGWLFMALAQHRRGHPDEAREWFTRASSAIDEQLRKDATGRPVLDWEEQVQLKVLRREAEALLNGKGAAPKK